MSSPKGDAYLLTTLLTDISMCLIERPRVVTQIGPSAKIEASHTTLPEVTGGHQSYLHTVPRHLQNCNILLSNKKEYKISFTM